MSKPRLLFSAPYSFLKDDIKKFNEYFEIDFIEIWKRHEFLALDLDYEFWIPNPGQNFVIDKSILKEMEFLKTISTPSTGTNHINLSDCKSKHVDVFGLLDQKIKLRSISASAEFTFLKILTSLRNIRSAWGEVELYRWRENEDQLRGYEISEKTFGLIGMGRIGNKLCKYLQAFDAKKIFFCDPHVDCDELNISKKKNLDFIFQHSDVVVVCCALNDETHSMISRKHLDLMTKDACLINTSRGEIINELELVEFLGQRPDIKFSADVITGEVNDLQMQNPLIPLHFEKKISLTPHIAGATYGSQTKAAVFAFEALIKNV
ncbi:hypothetical protein N9O22_02130 [Gammaproteobacteria bacterium]|nr:hypothetical protein [Gammaproteobacteria bacterium]